MPTIATRFSSSANNFDFLRLLAACCVILSHSYALTSTSYAEEPFLTYLGGYANGGELGVAVFFVISGFLITASATKRHLSDFLISRALRILPALALLILFEVFVVGPAFTTLSFHDYFRDPGTLDHFLNIFVFGIRGTLPGVFNDLPIKYVNASLWTLPVEVFCYLVLGGLALAKVLNRSIIAFITCSVAVLYAFILLQGITPAVVSEQIVRGVPLLYSLKYIIFFCLGSFAYTWKEKIPVVGGAAILCLLLLFAGTEGWAKNVIFYMCLPYLVLYAAIGAPPVFEKVRQHIGDLSYGVYLFGYPIQQMIVAQAPHKIGALDLGLCTLPLAFSMALISWHAIEKPALEWRQRSKTNVVAMAPALA